MFVVTVFSVVRPVSITTGSSGLGSSGLGSSGLGSSGLGSSGLGSSGLGSSGLGSSGLGLVGSLKPISSKSWSLLLVPSPTAPISSSVTLKKIPVMSPSSPESVSSFPVSATFFHQFLRSS